jgi:pyridoxamine 5'-phosphate oxidase
MTSQNSIAGYDPVFVGAPRRTTMTRPLHESLLPVVLPNEPFALLAQWIDDGRRSGAYVNPDAICLATAGADGVPHARMVLCRGLDVARGSLAFYTNRHSAKGRDLADRGEASAVFYWDHDARQAIVTGHVEHVADAESDAYWTTRPRLSQLAAWASAQSEPIASRAALLAQLEAVSARFGAESSRPVPRPEHWGGYRIVARRVELWSGSEGRMHDRAQWTRAARGWGSTRLQP